MTTVRNQVGLGTPGALAQALATGIPTGNYTTTGTAQGSQGWPSDFVVATSGSGTTGLTLPSNAAVGDDYTFVNHTGGNQLIWPPTGGKIANGSANASFTIGNTKTAFFICIDGTSWAASLSA